MVAEELRRIEHLHTSPRGSSPLQSRTVDRIRILIVLHQFLPSSIGGVELYTYTLAKELKKRFLTVQVLCPTYDRSAPAGSISADIVDDINVTRITLHPEGDLVDTFANNQAAFAFARFLDESEVDIVHFQHLMGLSGTSIHVCSRKQVPILMTVHDAWLICQQSHLLQPDGSFCRRGPETTAKCLYCLLRRYPHQAQDRRLPDLFEALSLRERFLRNALNSVDTLIFCSHFIQDIFRANGLEHKRMVFSPLGLAPFSPRPYQTKRDILCISFFGAVFFTKGLDLLIDAFNLLPPASSELHIYGPIVNQDYFREVMSRIKADRTVNYHGQYGSEQLPVILATTDITVIPSRMESFSLVTRESLHAKVPVIGPDIGGIPEVIQDNINGFLFRSGDYRDLANKLMILIRHPEKLNTLRNGIGPIRTIAEEVDELESIYQDALCRRGAPVGRRQIIAS